MPDLQKLACAVGFLLLFCPPVLGQPDPSPSVDAESSAYLLYSALSENDARAFYDSLPSKARSELWKAHLRRALREAPDLTVDQKLIIITGIGLVESGILNDSSLDEHEKTDLLDSFQERAKAEFDPDLGRAIFANLGPSVPLGEVGSSRFACNNIGHNKTQSYCSCSTDSDWCDFLTNPNPNCIEGFFLCVPRSSGCGTLWTYPCDGICGG